MIIYIFVYSTITNTELMNKMKHVENKLGLCVCIVLVSVVATIGSSTTLCYRCRLKHLMALHLAFSISFAYLLCGRTYVVSFCLRLAFGWGK